MVVITAYRVQHREPAGHAYLEVTYRNGPARGRRTIICPGRPTGRRTVRGRSAAAWWRDFDDRGEVVGIEITAPESLTLEAFNEALAGLRLQAVGGAELAPLRAAA